ncbi:MAG TPA: hypothetical protein VK171_08640, partial [Fimbriimonas sp.]|nr:hypothetical protein [Fimbriimonas sp.]
MPAARYWRLTRLESYDYGDLVLSEIALYEGVSRVDGSATISTVVPQSSGALSALSDADFGTSVTWPAAALLLPGFAIVWDFGSARDIVKVGLAGPSLLTFAHKAVLQYSSDGASWTNLTRQHFRTKWADPTTFHEFGEY